MLASTVLVYGLAEPRHTVVEFVEEIINGTAPHCSIARYSGLACHFVTMRPPLARLALSVTALVSGALFATA